MKIHLLLQVLFCVEIFSIRQLIYILHFFKFTNKLILSINLEWDSCYPQLRLATRLIEEDNEPEKKSTLNKKETGKKDMHEQQQGSRYWKGHIKVVPGTSTESTQSNSLLTLKKLAWRDSNKGYKKIGSNPVCKILQNNGLTQVKNCSDT